MLKRIKLKNSTVLLIGIIIIGIGVSLGLFEYFEARKNKTFSDMNIMLYENESPQNIDESFDSDNNEEIDSELSNSNQNNIENIDQNTIQNNEHQTNNLSNNYLGVLEIPKINLKRGFFDLGSKYNSVDYNVTVINSSTYPDVENNNLILAAHSGDCSICYFDDLYKLVIGDEAYIYYKNVKYVYKIVDVYEVEKDGTVAIYRDYSKNTLTLITCTRNSNTKQTVYILEQTN